MDRALVRIAVCNLEDDGGKSVAGVTRRWRGCHDLLASLNLDVVLRQELWKSVDPAAPDYRGDLLVEAEKALGMRGFVGSPPARAGDPIDFTGIFIREDTFELVDRRAVTFPTWLAPCNIRVRLDGGQPWGLVSFHADFASPVERARLGQWLTRLPDKAGQWAFMGGDCNSDPVPTEWDDPATPADQIADKPHVAHRFVEGPGGELVRDQELDKILYRAGMVDPAKVMAGRGKYEVLAGTGGQARQDQGRERRIDRMYMPPEFEEALVDLENVPNPFSDHHMVVVSFDRAKLTQVTMWPPPSHAERLRWAAEAAK